MKKLMTVLVLIMAGCVSTDLDADHVKKERATYNAMQPFVKRGIEASPDAEKKAGNLLNESWDERLKSYEERLQKRLAAQ